MIKSPPFSACIVDISLPIPLDAPVISAVFLILSSVNAQILSMFYLFSSLTMAIISAAVHNLRRRTVMQWSDLVVLRLLLAARTSHLSQLSPKLYNAGLPSNWT
jgi:hypothetical protein